MLPLLCRLPFGVFSGQHIFHKFRQQTYFFCPHFQQTFFSNFCGDKLFLSFFFQPPPPSRYQIKPPVQEHAKCIFMVLRKTTLKINVFILFLYETSALQFW